MLPNGALGASKPSKRATPATLPHHGKWLVVDRAGESRPAPQMLIFLGFLTRINGSSVPVFRTYCKQTVIAI